MEYNSKPSLSNSSLIKRREKTLIEKIRDWFDEKSDKVYLSPPSFKKITVRIGYIERHSPARYGWIRYLVTDKDGNEDLFVIADGEPKIINESFARIETIRSRRDEERIVSIEYFDSEKDLMTFNR